MKKNTLFYTITRILCAIIPCVALLCATILYPEQPEHTFAHNIELPPEIELLKKAHEQRTLEQVLNVENNPCPCLQFQGEKFIACMAYAAKEEVRTTFAHMNLYARLNYLHQMDLFEYHHFLSAFENEDQWTESISTLPPEEQEQLPATLLEQLIMIRDTWLECSDQTLGKYSRGEKDPQARDISAWRHKALNGAEKNSIDFHFFYLKWLHGRFTEKKVNNL